MGDVVFLAVVVAFFAAAVGLVHACDRIIGPDHGAEAGEQAPMIGRAASEDAPR